MVHPAMQKIGKLFHACICKRVTNTKGVQISRLKSTFINDKNTFTPRRAVLYVPGSDERKIKKISSLEVDCAVLDCEDGVAYIRKRDARRNITKLLPEILNYKQEGTEIVVRLNSVESGLLDDDLDVIMQGNVIPGTLMLPKVHTEEDITKFTNLLKKNLKRKELRKELKLITFVESALGLLNLRAVFESASQNEELFTLEGVVFGSDDFCADIGATRTTTAKELLYARQKVVTCAKAFKLQAIDLVHINYHDLQGLKEQSDEGASMGFTGKQVIHPGQIPVVQGAFSPSEDQVQWAKELIAAFESHQKLGKGAFTFKGNMIDMPVLLQARNIFEISQKLETRKK